MNQHELQNFSGFPCLVFPASKSLGDSATGLLGKLRTFLGTWDSHGVSVQGMACVLEDRFLVVAHRPQEISGCSRDALLFFVKTLGEEIGVEWLGGSRLFYRDEEGRVLDVDRLTFKQLGREGHIHPDTTVFDTTVQMVNAILENRFALAARLSWHHRLLTAVPAPA
jgi:hypothetical protein